MLHSFILPQQTISSIQERLEILEKCLNNANIQDEAMAKILELANSRQISLGQLREEFRQFLQKFNKLTELADKFNLKVEQGEIVVLLFVRLNFLLKEIVDQYWEFFLDEDSKEVLKGLTVTSTNFYMEIKKNTDLKNFQKDDSYIVLETLKHVILSLIKASLRVKALSEQEVNALNLGDITPQESETMLTSLASTQKWDWVYKNLA
ncbi:hypothetical protein I8752_02705 [Nostocaceae cyanobacterium CENA369]|uniref:Uncharacterized protein n=2 Tax=Dendronalium TaxID=2840442 RepID=A0A8J7LFG6_9NOST|nr:hypothetical protein [Dendronalium phyllosphericum CENA369]